MLVVTRFENLTDDTLALLGKAKLPVEILHDNNQQVPVGTVKAMLECGSKFTFTEAPSAPSAFEYGIMIGSLSARGTDIGYLLGDGEEVPGCEVRNVRFYQNVKALISDTSKKKAPAKRAVKSRAVRKEKEPAPHADEKKETLKPESKAESSVKKKVLPEYDGPSGMNPPEDTKGNFKEALEEIGGACAANKEAVEEALKECVDCSSFELILSDKVKDENGADEILQSVKPEFDKLMAMAQ